MKQTLITLLILALLAGCKKDSDKKKETLLSSVSTNGVPTSLYSYDEKNRLIRYDMPEPGVVQSANIQVVYNEDGSLKQLSTYSAGNVAQVRVLFMSDPAGRVDTYESYNLQSLNPHVPSFFGKYFYNDDNRISRVDARDKNNVLKHRINISYFPDGNIKETQTWEPQGNQLWLSGRNVYSLTDGSIVNSVYRIQDVLGPDLFASLFSDNIHEYNYDQNGVISYHRNIEATERIFNDDGTLKRQVQTITGIKPAKEPIVKNLTFEYIQK